MPRVHLPTVSAEHFESEPIYNAGERQAWLVTGDDLSSTEGASVAGEVERSF